MDNMNILNSVIHYTSAKLYILTYGRVWLKDPETEPPVRFITIHYNIYYILYRITRIENVPRNTIIFITPIYSFYLYLNDYHTPHSFHTQIFHTVSLVTNVNYKSMKMFSNSKRLVQIEIVSVYYCGNHMCSMLSGPHTAVFSLSP